MKIKLPLRIAIVLLSTFNSPLSAAPLGDAFTYQGRLNDGGSPAQGSYDLRFALFDSASGGSQVGVSQANSAVGVSNGLFTVLLDFGACVFDGTARWLDISVKTNGAGSYTTLTPRQVLSAAPHAAYALNAGTAATASSAASLSSPLTGDKLAGLYTGMTYFNHPSNVFTGTFFGQMYGGVYGSLYGNLFGNAYGDGTGLYNLNAANLAGGTVPDARLSGNVARLAASQIFSGPNAFTGWLTATNPLNQMRGAFFGDGSGLTGVTAVATAPGSVTGSSITSGQVVKSLNGLSDNISLMAGTNVSLSVSGSTITVSAALPTGSIVLSTTGANAALEAAGCASVADPNWYLGTANPGWEPRISFSATAFNGKLWVAGGSVNGNKTNDVWNSADGTNWYLATPAAAWCGRSGQSMIAYGGYLWVMGGSTATGYTNDVWCSTDGTTYFMVTNAAPWAPRNLSAVAELNGQMWVAGGVLTGNLRTNDIWSSPDGINWTMAAASPEWSSRLGQKMVSHGGKLWLMGGLTTGSQGVATSEVWSTSNGTNWTLVTNAPWVGRFSLLALEFNGQLWIIGGRDNNSSPLNDVWSSPNGLAWTQQTGSAAWVPRYSAGGDVLNGQLWVLGGQTNPSGSSSVSDAWYSNGLARLGQFFLFQKQ